MTSNADSMELARFLDYLEDRLGWDFDTEEFEDRFLLQKYVFFAQRLGLETDYEYNVYVFGAYSPALARDYYEESGNGSPVDIPISFDEDRFRSLIRNRDSRWLEIASTLVLFFERYSTLPFDQRKRKAIEKTMDEKDATEKTAEGVFRTLASEGLIS